MKTSIKKQIAIALVAIFSIVSLNSCKKDSTTLDRPSAVEFQALQNVALADLKQTATFDAGTGITFTSTKGTRLTIPPNALTKSGVLVTGNVTLEFTEIFDGGNMAATKKTTMGVLPDGNKAVMISGGEFNINVLQNGTLLELNQPMNLKTPANLTDSGLAQMDLFKGDIDAKGDLIWNKIQDSTGHGAVQIIDAVNPVNSNMELHYNTLVNNFGWTNIDRFYNYTGPKTTMLVSVPEGYNYDNCALYLHYDGKGSALARLDTYNASTKLFTEHYGQIPVGLECHLIFCTEENGQWKYAIKPITITAGTTYSVTEAEMQTSSKHDYVGHVTLLR